MYRTKLVLLTDHPEFKRTRSWKVYDHWFLGQVCYHLLNQSAPQLWSRAMLDFFLNLRSGALRTEVPLKIPKVPSETPIFNLKIPKINLHPMKEATGFIVPSPQFQSSTHNFNPQPTMALPQLLYHPGANILSLLYKLKKGKKQPQSHLCRTLSFQASSLIIGQPWLWEP